MARVERGNVVLHVADHEIPYYLSIGYAHTDETGQVIEAAVPSNMGELRLHYVEGKAKIAELEAEIESLKSYISELESASTKKKSKKAEKED